MSTERQDAEDRVELAEARRLAAEDVFGLMRRLVTSGQARPAELSQADEALMEATRAVQQAYRVVADISEVEISDSLKRMTGRPEVEFRVAVKFECGWRESPDQAGCPRVAGRVLVVGGGGSGRGEDDGPGDGEPADGEVWVWLPCGGDASHLGPPGLHVGVCSRHGERPLAHDLFEAAVEAARRHPNRWPIPR